MLIYRAYKTELKLNNRERTLLVGCAGAARFAFNWLRHEATCVAVGLETKTQPGVLPPVSYQDLQRE